MTSQQDLRVSLVQGDTRWHDPAGNREHYAALPHKAGECIACGACSGRCPFGVDAVENMRRAQALFGA